MTATATVFESVYTDTDRATVKHIPTGREFVVAWSEETEHHYRVFRAGWITETTNDGKSLVTDDYRNWQGTDWTNPDAVIDSAEELIGLAIAAGITPRRDPAKVATVWNGMAYYTVCPYCEGDLHSYPRAAHPHGHRTYTRCLSCGYRAWEHEMSAEILSWLGSEVAA